MRIDFYSHYFIVSEMSDLVRKTIYQATGNNLVLMDKEYVDGRYVTEMKRVFAFSPTDRSYIRFHINFYETLVGHLKYAGIDVTQHKLVYHEMSPEQAQKVEFIKRPSDDEDREYQSKINANLHAAGSNKVVNLQPGAGKTKITMGFAFEFGYRTQAVMSSKYLDQWADEIEKYFDISPKDIFVIRGSKSLRAMMQLMLDGDMDNNKVILISIETMAAYLEDVEKDVVPPDFYPIHPNDFFVKMKIGLNVIDEGHQNLHRVCRLFCHMNVLKSITLSATLNTKDKFINSIMELMYPKVIRDTGGYKNVYIASRCVHYHWKRPGRIRCTGWKGSYNHTKFEESLLRSANRSELENYMKMLKYFIERDYVNVKKPEQRAIIFFSTKNMCTYAKNYFQKAFPDLNVARYIGEDNKSVLEKADLTVSTVLSAGTAIDIPNLIINFLTIGIDSQIANEQTLGRTRPVKNEPSRTPWFVWFSCSDIDKHVRYTRNKKDFLSDKVLHIVDENYPYAV